MNKVLIADDNTQITKVLKDYASKEGWGCYVAYNGEEALRLFREFSREITIVFLDVMMPRKDGFAVCKAIRAMSQVPVIMITARSEDADKIMGLDIGADDYIVKPFSGAEVMARVRAVMRRLERTAESAQHALSCGNLTLYPGEIRAAINGETVPLTRKEFDLLCLFAENKGRAFSRDHLLDRLWGWDYEGDTRTVDTHIKRLRAKLAKFPHDDWDIKTVWGVGYALEATS